MSHEKRSSLFFICFDYPKLARKNAGEKHSSLFCLLSFSSVSLLLILITTVRLVMKKLAADKHTSLFSLGGCIDCPKLCAVGLTYKYETGLKKHDRTNTLAYFASMSAFVTILSIGYKIAQHKNIRQA